MRGDSEFLWKMGIERYVLDDPYPEPRLPEPEEPAYSPSAMPSLTKESSQWLMACGVAWEPDPGFQLSMNFCMHL